MSAALKQTEIAARAAAVNTVKTVSAFSIAIWISVAVHATILTIHFQPELSRLKDNLPSLDVVLVNAKTKSEPDKADALAQANLDRGGNTDENRKMKTALPAPKEKTTQVNLNPSSQAHSSAKSAKKKAQEAREQKRVEELEKQAQEHDPRPRRAYQKGEVPRQSAS